MRMPIAYINVYLKSQILIFVLVAYYLLVPHSAEADVYKYVSEDGVVTFTDAPVNRKAVLIMRDIKPSANMKKKKSPVTGALPAAKSFPIAGRRVNLPGLLMMPISGRITSTVGLRFDPFNGNLRNHEGIDIAVPEGTAVRPVAPGVVSYSGGRNGYGNIVILEHDDGMITLYAHNRNNLVSAGMRVDRGTTIALSGSTGRSTGPHLHFEAWYNGDNITETFVENQTGMTTSRIVARAGYKHRPARKVMMADGTILLTNLPLVHP